MIVCVCKNVSEAKIVKAIENGSTFEELQMDLGVATRCGCCTLCIMSLIKKHKPTTQDDHE